MAPMEEAQFAKRFFADIQARDLEAAKLSLDPKVINSQVKEKLSAMANIFPNEAPKSIKFSGFREIKADGVFSNVTIYMQYEYSDRWILATAHLQKLGGNFVVTSAEAQPNRDSIENFNKFKFWDKTSNTMLFLSRPFYWCCLKSTYFRSVLKR